MIKASAGGGGIGMLRVNNSEQLLNATNSAMRAAERAFGDSRIYIERYLECPRHVEIQVLRAKNGFQRVLGNRECSVQRRYQKLLEECPSPALGALASDKPQELELLALKLFESVDYVGVGTVELLLDNQAGHHFLEVNARLQVEHTVTESVFGVDLVEQQLRIAAGDDVSRDVTQLQARGHAIEARIYAEDPSQGFLPQPGRVEEASFAVADGIRIDCGIERGASISSFYDPLVAKITAWGPTRGEATERLRWALAETRLIVSSKRGLRANNLQLLQKILASAEWRSGNYDTGLVEKLVASLY